MKYIIIFFVFLIILFLIIHFLINCKKKKNETKLKKVSPIQKDVDYDKKIFISIASYRDKDCPQTILSIFQNATRPHNIFLGICQQNSDEDMDALTDIPHDYQNNIRIIRLKDTDAKGPTYARWICSKLYRNEDYFMQIDSHSKFVKDWDSKLLKMIQSIPDEKAVLSNYPNDWNTMGENDNTVPVFCSLTFEEKILKPRALLISPDEDFFQIPCVSGGFFFTKGSFLKDVPYDPDLPHLFSGEEILFSIRLWTHGYNFYAPNERIIYHYYNRNESPKYWDSPEYQKWQPLSFKKVEYILGLKKTYHHKLPLEPSSNLGKVRSLDDYYSYIQFDKKKKKSKANFC